jgi:hypothetical protein
MVGLAFENLRENRARTFVMTLRQVNLRQRHRG